MPINTNTLMVVDLETTSPDPQTTEITEIGAICINPRTLELIEGSEFQILMKPTDFSKIQAGALQKTGITKEQLEGAAEAQTGWNSFVEYVNNYNPKKSSTKSAPIGIGYNYIGFDQTIINRYCAKYKTKRLFNELFSVDLMLLNFMFFESTSDLEDYKFDTFRKYTGLSETGAHRALKDVKDEAQWFIRMLKFCRKTFELNKFRNCFGDNNG